MYIFELADDNDHVQEYALLTVYTVDGYPYAALVPVQDDEPLQADVVIYACEGDLDNLDLYEIDDENEYNTAVDAFRRVVASL